MLKDSYQANEKKWQTHLCFPQLLFPLRGGTNHAACSSAQYSVTEGGFNLKEQHSVCFHELGTVMTYSQFT